jgi:hypothetical protein
MVPITRSSTPCCSRRESLGAASALRSQRAPAAPSSPVSKVSLPIIPGHLHRAPLHCWPHAAPRKPLCQSNPMPPANPLASKSSAWSGRFDEPVADMVLRYTASVGFDQRLAFADIEASLAHAAMLARAAIISAADLATIEQRTRCNPRRNRARRIRVEDRTGGRTPEHREAADRPGRRCRQAAAHRALAQRPGRDRPAFVAARRDRPHRAAAGGVQHTLVELAGEACSTVMPGYTHLQVAQPVTFGHHLLAYVEMFERDRERMLDARRRVNRCRSEPRRWRAPRIRSTASSCRKTRIRRGRNQFARRGRRSRLCDRVLQRSGDHDDARIAAG